MSITKGQAFGAAFLLAACGHLTPALADPLPCDEGIKMAFRPDADTSVVAVRLVKKGEELKAPDAPQPVTAAADLCLVKLLVGPGATAETDKSARSYAEGIGIEVWLPTPANWNERIRNYGGGGWVGGGHRYPDKIGSKVPAIVNANIGYASGTTDAGQPWYQDGSFAFLSNGKINVESLRDFSVRAMVEQAVKTRALVNLYYGKTPKYAYYDGHSQGGRQGMKLVQEYPELYDGYMIAQPALNIAKFGAAGLYPQIVMKTELGFTSANRIEAAAFATKVAAANKRAVAACDKAGLGFLLDPFACDYNPACDAETLCAGEAGEGVTGSNPDAATCMNLKEANALNRIWYGATSDGSFDVAQSADARSGKSLGKNQLWWTFTKSTAIGTLITSASSYGVALALQDVSYAPDASTSSGEPITNGSTNVRNKWMELDYAGLADAMNKGVALQPTLFSDLIADKADLGKLRDLGRKVIVYSGLVDDAIPPAGNINYHERVVAAMGGHAEVQKFMRMYLLPGSAHSSQGRAYTVDGKNDSVPLPRLPGNANQMPTREQDQFFTALVDWVEKGTAPGEITLTSRDNSVSYPVCVYPLRTTWNGNGNAKQASSFGCR
ncbi:tannase/feruloyl esterase family alpha/beta hydrolase [Bradyrhizobium australiense]|uniref:Tannase/feruloyl esterase family alpha/beta hydrolase n=1 Tax=Bradyrhizobium australiense TaxID=2721161 RepID=A0A7Y4LVK2_9BRAD|nr:tannase/feruloyl esterase family alpha/beta hydrolase [Bradyrhizobium australiense]NOJ39750.1 tannase/feruloyl esterase family alpha/beta hydrolase [Bradyrhizobium australiense]